MINQSNLPAAFLTRLEALVDKDRLAEILEALSINRPTTFRLNRLKITLPKLKKLLQQQGVTYQQLPWYEDAFILTHPSKRELIDLDLYKQGLIYIQSLSSMIPALVLQPSEHELICDLTAAPGSKTTQMAAMMGNTGQIIANDKSRIRLYKLQYNLKLQGVTNVKTTYLPGQSLWKKCPEHFDKTLLDAPCSLEGRFNSQNPKTYRDWTLKKVKILAEYQKQLLRSAVSLTKVGGTIVYSTCSLSVEENEAAIDWLLKKVGDAVVVEPITLPVPNLEPGLTTWDNQQFDPQISNTRRIYPSKLMEGFFIARLKKLRSSV